MYRYARFLARTDGETLWVCENRVANKIFGPKRDEVTGEWRRLHNQKLHNFYCSVNQMKDDKTDGRVACTGEKWNANRILVVKPEGKRPFERSTRKWGENIKSDLREIWRSKTQVCGRSLAGIPDSNPTGGEGGDGFLSLVGVVCSQVEVSATGWSLV